MSWKSRLEDRHTVQCRYCGHESIDPHKRPRQKYSKGKCANCHKGGKE